MQGFQGQFRIRENFDPDRRIKGITQGQFILDGETIFLQTGDGDRFDLDRVAVMSSAFNDLDGVLRWPKPTIYDDNGNVEAQGDLLIVSFANGDVFNPVVMGSIIPLHKNDFFHDYERTTYQQKKVRFETEQAIIEFQDDGKGELQLDVTGQAGESENGTGNITVNLTGVDEANGNITVNVSGNATVSAAKDVLVEATNEVTIKGDAKTIVNSPLIELGEGATEALVLGNSWQSLYAAHIHSTPAGPSGPPGNASQAGNCLSTKNTTL